jgi:hypothetical protein
LQSSGLLIAAGKRERERENAVADREYVQTAPYRKAGILRMFHKRSTARPLSRISFPRRNSAPIRTEAFTFVPPTRCEHLVALADRATV